MNPTMRLPYPPSLNRYLRHTGRTYKTAEAGQYAGQARVAALAVGVSRPLSGPVAVAITLHPRLTQKGKASASRLDLDNALKVALDALQGIAYHDDNQVEDLHARLGTPVKDGGLSITVSSMSPTAGMPALAIRSRQSLGGPLAETRNDERNEHDCT